MQTENARNMESLELERLATLAGIEIRPWQRVGRDEVTGHVIMTDGIKWRAFRGSREYATLAELQSAIDNGEALDLETLPAS